MLPILCWPLNTYNILMGFLACDVWFSAGESSVLHKPRTGGVLSICGYRPHWLFFSWTRRRAFVGNHTHCFSRLCLSLFFCLSVCVSVCVTVYHTTTGDPNVLDVPPPINNDSYPILREEVEAAVKSLKKGKWAGVDNIPSELVQAGGEAMIDMLLIICNKIWQTGE